MDEARGAGGGPHEWKPSTWLRALASAAPAAWPVGRSVRAALGVGGPVLVGALLGDAVTGMWVSMGTLLLAAGERSTAYPVRFRQIAVTTPLAAAAYLLGALSTAPPWLVVLVMAALAFASGVVSGYSSALSVATMQALLIAAIAVGVSAAAPYWRPALLFVAGAGIAAALLAVEVLVNRSRPQRDALAAMLRALAALAHAQADGDTDLAAPRARALTAIDAYERLGITRRGHAQGPARDYDRAAAVARAADQLLARLLAHDAVPERSAATATRLGECADAVLRRRRPAPSTAPEGTLVRLRLLESALWDDPKTTAGGQAAHRERLVAPGPALLASAGRLALCTALAYVAYFVLPVPHAYWIPLTVALVMKPDLGSVFGRAVLRSVGTVGGAVVAVLLGLVLHGSVLLSVVLAVLAACLPWAMARSYAFQALVLTPLIMLLLDAVVPHEDVWDLTLARVETTVLGGLLVVVAGYLVWPSARHVRVSATFGSALAALAAYARAVADDGTPEAVTPARRAAYRELADTRVSLQRTLSEPPPAGAEAWAWIPVVSAAERVADRVTDVSASLATTQDAAALDDLADDLAALARTGDRADMGRRTPVAPVHGGDSPDPTVRALADDVASLGSMLTRERSPRPARRERSAVPR
ncbi:FUSC family protein [Cellulosimicrobium cellulans]|uniref:FUSC family protein n=1 Tax=Cellulosimicrobium cellulans TaxID=1710 RepID=UPI0027DDF761|nr:FUSC family protein [Cellulosimicrobium cellulans]